MFKSLRGTPAEACFIDAVDDTSIDILEQSQTNLKNNGSSVTGKLLNSGRTEPAKVKGDEVFGYVGYASDHAYYLEFGRKAGGMPPVEDIEEWVKKRGITASPYAIAKSIAAKGTVAHPYLYPAFENRKARILTHLKTRYQELIAGITR